MTRTSACALLTVLVLGVTVEAHASVKTYCTVQDMQYDKGRLAVWCSGDSDTSNAPYYVFSSETPFESCSTESTTTIEIWQGLFESAIMAGRLMDFDFEYPTSTCSIKRISARVKLR